MKVAVIDTGTNSTRLLVADVSQGRIEEVYRQTKITRLGEKVDRDGNLNADARLRVTSCVDEYASRIDGLGVSRTMVLATSSVRDAGNGKQFLRSLAEHLGFEWKLLSGDEEAGLSYSGATASPGLEGAVNLFDIGGGSTEVVSGNDGRVVFARSLRLGCVRITERFIYSDPVTRQELVSAREYIDEVLDHEIETGRLNRPARTIAVAGTVTALAAIDLGLKSYDPVKINGHIMSLARITELLEGLSGMDLMQRVSLATIESGRADVIVAGTLILERLMLHTGAEELTVSELDILDGAALALASGEL
ncbi:MAG: Ppx/GppA phosphatase family protein [Thermoleophilia bacterium]|nr:Ppx/GppA phosphatase family protein [Thermoleophilia bacterium]